MASISACDSHIFRVLTVRECRQFTAAPNARELADLLDSGAVRPTVDRVVGLDPTRRHDSGGAGDDL